MLSFSTGRATPSILVPAALNICSSDVHCAEIDADNAAAKASRAPKWEKLGMGLLAESSSSGTDDLHQKS